MTHRDRRPSGERSLVPKADVCPTKCLDLAVFNSYEGTGPCGPVNWSYHDNPLCLVDGSSIRVEERSSVIGTVRLS